MCEDAVLHDSGAYSCNGFLRLLFPVCYGIVNIFSIFLMYLINCNFYSTKREILK